jgi:hypothetical protein
MEDGTVSIFGPIFGVATAAPDSHAVLLAGAQAGFVLLDGGPGNPWGQPSANLRRRGWIGQLLRRLHLQALVT